MILVDYRKGSKHLTPYFEAMGLPVNKGQVTLPFADVAFEGRGDGDEPIQIGVELKRLSDMFGSLRDGRLPGHQLPGLVGPKGFFDLAWLVVEGVWDSDAAGKIVVPKKHSKGWILAPGGIPVSELEKRVLTLEMCAGLHVRFTNSEHATARFIANLYRWWTDKSLDEHRSHLAIHTASAFLPISDFRATVADRFPGVGIRTSLAVEAHFGGSLQRACNAPAREWAEITTVDKHGKPRRLGTKIAEQIVTFVRGGSNGNKR